MIATLTALMASKYGKYALEIFIVVGLVFGAYKWAEHRGRDSQKQADDQQQTQQIENSRKEAQDAKDKLVEHANADATAADARAKAAEDRFNSLATMLQGIAGKQQQANDHVRGLSDSQLHGDVVAQLKLRSPRDDPTACYTPAEERAIDDAITQLPLCRQQSAALGQQVTSAQQDTAAARDKAAALQTEIDALDAYRRALEAAYKELHDQHPPRYRGAECLWLWKCGKQKVDFRIGAQAPSPAEKAK
jgi:chromosome segregation ATPase